ELGESVFRVRKTGPAQVLPTGQPRRLTRTASLALRSGTTPVGPTHRPAGSPARPTRPRGGLPTPATCSGNTPPAPAQIAPRRIRAISPQRIVGSQLGSIIGWGATAHGGRSGCRQAVRTGNRVPAFSG